MKITAIITAAGMGKRFNGGTDKAFLKINGEPLILMSLDVFRDIPQIDEIIVTLNENNMANGKKYLNFEGVVRIVKGGDKRADSVKTAVFESKNDFVLIHDAVRPLIKKDFVLKIITALDNASDGVIPVVAVKYTMKEKDDNGFVRKTIPRGNLVEVQTPQFFRKESLIQAYKKISLAGITDEAMLIESIGGRVKTVEGLVENIKITTPFDFFIISKIIEQWKKE